MYKSTFCCGECEFPVKLDLFFLNIYYEEICCLTGRTGRAGRGGKAVTFFTEDDAVNLRRSVKRFKVIQMLGNNVILDYKLCVHYSYFISKT